MATPAHMIAQLRVALAAFEAHPRAKVTKRDRAFIARNMAESHAVLEDGGLFDIEAARCFFDYISARTAEPHRVAYVEPAPAQDMHTRASASFLADAAARCADMASKPADQAACDAVLAALESGLVASGAIEAPTLPAFDSFICAGDSVSVDHDGFTITATIHVDHDADAPWDHEDGHGIVTGWVSRNKEPGELVLSNRDGMSRYYDFAGTCAEARRDGWAPLAWSMA